MSSLPYCDQKIHWDRRSRVQWPIESISIFMTAEFIIDTYDFNPKNYSSPKSALSTFKDRFTKPSTFQHPTNPALITAPQITPYLPWSASRLRPLCMRGRGARLKSMSRVRAWRAAVRFKLRLCAVALWAFRSIFERNAFVNCK